MIDWEASVWKKVDASGDCWLWTGYITPLGYGTLTVRRLGRGFKAHRLVYELLVGPIPVGLELDHLCRNTRCVNPDHLEPVTHAENMRRSPVLNIPPKPKARGRTQLIRQPRAPRKVYDLSIVPSVPSLCRRGHELTPQTVRTRVGKGWDCRICHRIHHREWKARQRQAVA